MASIFTPVRPTVSLECEYTEVKVSEFIPAHEGVRLLVVDEDERFTDLLRDLAEEGVGDEQIECKVIGSGEQAMPLVRDWGPTTVILDAHISDVNSIALLQYCADRGTSVLFASSSWSQEIEKSAMLHGASGYVLKSNDPDEIEYLLEQIILFSSEQIRICRWEM